MVELSHILFSQMFTCFSYARQNVAEKMEIIAGELPKYKLLSFSTFQLIQQNV